ncbi:energy-coupling factor transporter transmembrane component T family protein [Malacoplasma muris]|uniref:energy-coupling factor transporter transmembrane component T family protein n=1 Tax=Malacoplasma muris TaxID=2119 RepID=UPI00398F6903
MNYNGYVYRNSIIHRMNPSIKFLTSILFIILIFIPYGFFTQLIILAILLIIYFLAKLPIKKFINILISIIVMMVILFAVNWLTYKGPGVVFNLQNKINFLIPQSTLTLAGPKHFIQDSNGAIFLQGYMWGSHEVDLSSIGLSYEYEGQTKLLSEAMFNINGSGFHKLNADVISSNDKDKILQAITTAIKKAGYSYIKDNVSYIYVYKSTWYSLSSFSIMLMLSVSLKIFLMILIVTILTATTSSVELTYALEDILNPLRIFRLPVTVWSTTIALGIRFIPSLLDESERIMKAQASRGLDFKNGNLKDKLLSLTSFIVPLFSIAFKKADELANAMEARGYNPRYTRTRYRDYKITMLDWFVYLLLGIFLGVVIALITVIGSGKIAYISPLGLLEATTMFGR